MHTVAFDLDEVVFPFALEYARWRSRNGLPTFDPATLTHYDFTAALGDIAGGETHTTEFLEDLATLDVAPLEGAARTLIAMGDIGRLVAVTNRYETQAPGTLRWLDHRLSGVFDDVIFARPAPKTTGRSKYQICLELDAAVLVDDSPEHLAQLAGVAGVLFGQYPWQGADADRYLRARTWADVSRCCTQAAARPRTNWR
jgi:FMN phosphatase YigB (HAD superfamily)